VFDYQLASTKPSWVQDMFNFPTGRSDPTDVTGSVEKPKEEAPKPAAPAAEAPKPDGSVVYPDRTQQVSPSERAILERLQARRQELETRAREIDIRASLLKAAEKRIESQTEELKATESRITTPTQIAPRKMSDILGLMAREAAERLTVEMARRAGSDKSTSASAADLPKIE